MAPLKDRRYFFKSAASFIAAPHIAISSEQNSRIKLGAIYSVPINQQWVSKLHEAALNLVVRGEISYVYIDDVNDYQYEEIFNEISSNDVDMVIGDVFAYEERARLLALNHPNVSYLMGSAFQPNDQIKNFSVFDSYIQDASYLSGIIGAGLSKSGRIGIVARHSLASINRNLNAFIDGTRELKPNAKFSIDYLNSWYDLSQAKAITKQQIDLGVDTIIADASGVMKVATENNIPVIGSFHGMDKFYADKFVTSARWHFEPTLKAAIDRLREGRLTSTDFGVYSYMRHHGCSLSTLNQYIDQIPENTIELAALREFEMRSSQFTANVNTQRPLSSLN